MSIALGLFAAFAAMFVKGLSGFGNTLVFTPLMNFQYDSKLISPVDLLIGMPANAYMAWRERKSISLKIALPLVILIYIGLIPGTIFLNIGDVRLLKVILGVAIVVLGIEMLLREKQMKSGVKKKSNPLVLGIIGLGSGVLCGLFGVGAFLTAYLNRTTNNSSQFRANFCIVFLLENIARFSLYLYSGILTWESAKFAVMLLPACALGLAVGILASRKIPEQHAKKVVSILLVLTGLSLTLQNIGVLFPDTTMVGVSFVTTMK